MQYTVHSMALDGIGMLATIVQLAPLHRSINLAPNVLPRKVHFVRGLANAVPEELIGV